MIWQVSVQKTAWCYFAGRATTIERRLDDHVIRTGYLVPTDAQQKEAEISWVDLDSWLRMIAVLPAKHILVILDMCGTGVALDPVIRWRSAAPDGSPVNILRARQSRRVITSGLDDQELLEEGPVRGCSLFAGCLIEALESGVASGRDGAPYVTGGELGLYLQRRVSTFPGSRQTPDFGAFAFDNRGEMVIPLLHPPASS
jgi:hypothetical protein